MTTRDKYLVHLESVIFDSLPEGRRLNATQIGELIARSTKEQRRTAFKRGLDHSPIFLADEIAEALAFSLPGAAA